MSLPPRKVKALAAKTARAGAAKGHQTKRLRAGEAGKVVLPQKSTGRGGKLGVTQRDAKAVLLDAFDRLGGVAGLVKWGRKNPTEFYRIWARLLPKDANIAITAMPLEDLLAQLTDMDEAGASMAEAAEQLRLTSTVQ